MKRVKISDLEALMFKALSIRNIKGPSAKLIVEDYLGSQLEGRLTHGLGKFLLIDSAIKNRNGAPFIIEETESFALINGNRELGQVAATYATEILISKVKKQGVGIVGMNNASRYSRLSVIGQLIAQNNIVGIIMNNAGPAAVTPYNGLDPILGTNPICFAFPNNGENLIVDFSTAERTWGEIRQATLEHRDLPPDAFLDSSGNITRDPNKAHAVLPFGGAKGFALCLAIEILAGSLVAAKMGLNIEDQYDLGFLFIGVDINTFSESAIFKSSVSSLLHDIRSSRSKSKNKKLRIPGEGARQNAKKTIDTGFVQIDLETHSRLIQMAEGIESGLMSNNQLD